ncbi:MAG: hypothetical protein K0B11_14700 [Mariniphaga sp.]|nr:hypothetical protein [Mariniphaga sp.]
MTKIRSILLGIVCIALTSLSFLQSNTKSSFDLDLESLLNISQAQAESGGDCMSWGYRKWNCGSLYGDGVDCACTEREQVNNDCE